MKKTFVNCYMVVLFTTVTFSCAMPVQAQTIHYFVSPTGNDKNSGQSIAEAFATLQKARDAVRINRITHPDDSAVVFLAAGEYNFSEPLLLTPEDAGTKKGPVIYTALGQDKVIWNGSKKISGWKKLKKNIWVAEIPEVKKGEWNFKQLFVNGKSRARAHLPHSGFYRVDSFPDGGRSTPIYTPCRRFGFARGDMKSTWENIEDIEVIVYHFWTDQHFEIQSINDKERIVTFKYPSGKIFTDDFNNDGARYIVDNVREGLQAPGDWYLDRKKGELYYIPMPDEDMRTSVVAAPYTPSFLHLKGSPLQNKWVSDIQFRNINLIYSNTFLPQGNTNDRQGSSDLPAIITLEGAKDCVFDHCTISDIGGCAFDIQQGCSGNTFSFNRLSQLGGGGFRLNGGIGGDHPLLQTHSNIITDNEIGYYGGLYPSSVAVLLMQSADNKILHNSIHDGYYTGISIGWEWGYQRSISRDNLIAYNHIYNIGKGLLADMGGIYTLGVSPGTVIRNNLIHDVDAHNYGGWGIYNDEGSTHILIENNIVYNTKFAAYNIHYAKELTVRNNIFAFGLLQQVSRSWREPHQSVYFENNIIYWKEGKLLDNDWRDKPYSFYFGPDSLQRARQVTSSFSMDYNTYYNPTLPLDSINFNNLSWKEWRQTGKDIHSSFIDPLFTNPEKYDFTLQPNSPVFSTGFKAIDMTEVGPRTKQPPQ